MALCLGGAVKIYHYPKCSTCRKAIAWLDAKGVALESQDLVKQPPSKAELENLWKRSGLPIQKLFNTSGESYRNGGFKDKVKTMSEDQALSALAKDGKLIKRPILDTGDAVLVGFEEKAYKAAL
jgi:arsenate reductase (glutaredoxin)